MRRSRSVWILQGRGGRFLRCARAAHDHEHQRFVTWRKFAISACSNGLAALAIENVGTGIPDSKVPNYFTIQWPRSFLFTRDRWLKPELAGLSVPLDVADIRQIKVMPKPAVAKVSIAVGMIGRNCR